MVPKKIFGRKVGLCSKITELRFVHAGRRQERPKPHYSWNWPVLIHMKRFFRYVKSKGSAKENIRTC